MQHNTALLDSIDYLPERFAQYWITIMTSPSPLTAQSEIKMLKIVATLSRTVVPTLPEMIALLTLLAALAARDKTMAELPEKLVQALLLSKAARSMPEFLILIEEAGI